MITTLICAVFICIVIGSSSGYELCQGCTCNQGPLIAECPGTHDMIQGVQCSKLAPKQECGCHELYCPCMATACTLDCIRDDECCCTFQGFPICAPKGSCSLHWSNCVPGLWWNGFLSIRDSNKHCEFFTTLCYFSIEWSIWVSPCRKIDVANSNAQLEILLNSILATKRKT